MPGGVLSISEFAKWNFAVVAVEDAAGQFSDSDEERLRIEEEITSVISLDDTPITTGQVIPSISDTFWMSMAESIAPPVLPVSSPPSGTKRKEPVLNDPPATPENKKKKKTKGSVIDDIFSQLG